MTAEEVVHDKLIDHALRFILPNISWMQKGYINPASHGTRAPNATNSYAPFYVMQFRLRPSFNVSSLPNKGDRVVATALKTYGTKGI